MLRLLFAAPTLLVFSFLYQQPATPAGAAADAPATANPVKPTAESQARARKIYAMDCAMCHGATGDGKGELVADLQITVKDLNDPSTLSGMSDGDLFNIIKNGKNKMPGEANRVKTDEVWNLVILMRAYSKK